MRILASVSDETRRVQVVERLADGARHYLDSGVLYTSIDADGVNAVPYIAAMADALPRRGRILVLGTAGGALPSLLHATGAAVTAVDIWSGAFTLARTWFHMPTDVECVTSDAAGFIAQTQESWDAIAIDVFDGVNIPPALLRQAFAQGLARVIAPGGLVVWNVAAGLWETETLAVTETLYAAGFEARARSVYGDERLANTLVFGARRKD